MSKQTGGRKRKITDVRNDNISSLFIIQSKLKPNINFSLFSFISLPF